MLNLTEIAQIIKKNRRENKMIDVVNDAVNCVINSKTILPDGIMFNMGTALAKLPPDEIEQFESSMLLDADYELMNETSIGNILHLLRHAPTEKIKQVFRSQLVGYFDYVQRTSRVILTKNVDLRAAYLILFSNK